MEQIAMVVSDGMPERRNSYKWNVWKWNTEIHTNKKVHR